ncbi:MAG: site-specific DNA-methyltransferase [Anaerolineae bacterium]|nr:MAG: site-specific DNA-methyltransferase [Anaerolineae bacterium]
MIRLRVSQQGVVVRGDNLPILKSLADGQFDLIYIDPPFNTGKKQSRTALRTTRDENGDRIGFQGRRYLTKKGTTQAFDDRFNDYLGFLEPRLAEAKRLLSWQGTLYLHVDYREAHYCKILLDGIFGRENFLNEIIWAYDYGGRSKRKWPAKHDTILVYVTDPATHIFNYEDIERIPYMAPGLVGEAKAARGKVPTDTWWHTIVSPTGKEKTGYPTQKPLGVLNRIVQASSNPDSRVLDFFAGSGTTGVAAANLGRKFFLVDSSPDALQIMKSRLPEGTLYYEEATWLNQKRSGK